jgi:photosystem II stability/assembly factor-like uncharacterized protein
MMCVLTAVAVAAVPEAIPSSEHTDAVTRMKSWEMHVRLTAESPFRNLHWRAVGPKFQGGRIETIACPPSSTTTIYIGAGAGNVWKTVNNGITWQPIFEHESTFTIGAIAVAQSDPDTVWVGTGENLMARSSFAGTGVFKSTDAGNTWQNMGLSDTHHIGRIVIHPQDSDIVYVAGLGHQYTYNNERGLFKTVDGGKTWNRCLFISNRIGVVDVTMDPSDSQVLYAAAWERDRKTWNNVVCGEGTAVYKTTDAGTTWNRLINGFPVSSYLGRMGLAVAPSNPNIIYTVVDNQMPVTLKTSQGERKGVVGGEVYRSDDKGETWKKVSQDLRFVGINYSFGDIRVSPDDENQVYICGVSLAVSMDGGKTFRKVDGPVIHLHYHPSRSLHLDQHDFWIDPANPDRLLLGNDGGLYLSNDRGKNWLHLNNLPIGEFYAISVDTAEPYNIYGGTQDNAALYGPSDQDLDPVIEDAWKQIWVDIWGGGDSYYTLVDPTNPDIIYYEQQFGDFKRKDMRTGEIKRIRPQPQKGKPELRFNWMTPFLISHHNPLILYVGANELFKSLYKGDSWICISPDLSTQPGPEKHGNVPYGTITTISESPLKPGLLYVGTDDGNVWVTNNDGVTWAPLNQRLPGKWISRIVASSHNLETVYVALTGYREDDFETYLFKSGDFGKTWTSLASNLPAESVNVICEDPDDSLILYAGTDQGGVYVSLDGGQTWLSLCADLPTTPVHDIAIQPREREMAIGTHGRSIFVLDIDPVQKFKKIQNKEAHLFEIRPPRLPQRRDYPNDWAWETGKKAVIHYYLKKPHSVKIHILDDSGKMFRELPGTGDAGLNRAVWDLGPEREGLEPPVYGPGLSLVKPGIYKVRIQAVSILLEGVVQVQDPLPEFKPGNIKSKRW